MIILLSSPGNFKFKLINQHFRNQFLAVEALVIIFCVLSEAGQMLLNAAMDRAFTLNIDEGVGTLIVRVQQWATIIVAYNRPN